MILLVTLCAKCATYLCNQWIQASLLLYSCGLGICLILSFASPAFLASLRILHLQNQILHYYLPTHDSQFDICHLLLKAQFSQLPILATQKKQRSWNNQTVEMEFSINI